MLDELDIVTCPRCGKTSDLNDFDIFLACPGNVFCTQCHCEFDSDSETGGQQHRPSPSTDRLNCCRRATLQHLNDPGR